MQLGYWPDAIPLPELMLPDLELTHVFGVQYLVVPEGVTPRRISYSGETYLQLANVGKDIPALLRFMHRHGPLYGPGRRSKLEPFFADVDDETTEVLHEGFEAVMRGKRHLSQYACTLYELRRDAALVSDMTSAWRVWSGTQTLKETDWMLEPGEKPIRSRADAATFLVRALSGGLSAFQPGISLLDSRDESVAETTPNMTPRFHYTVGTFAACCAELFNHIAENATYRRCKNPTCGRFFVRQQGRAKHGQHRMHGEVKYCSRSCATSVSKRKYREKKKQEAKNL